MAPFVMNRILKPMLEKSLRAKRFIVNVSSMEGKFNRKKVSTHPHMNMAKAALNMMTRTSAQDYVKSGIYMNSVDTGWINIMEPVQLGSKLSKVKGNWHTPLDEIDAAARVLDPCLAWVEDEHGQRLGEGKSPEIECPYGKFLKDYKQSEW